MISAVACLAYAIYFEAGNQTLEGKVAVGKVVMNRVASKVHPNTVCEVIKKKDQFSFYWDGKPEIIPDNTLEQTAKQESRNVAEALLSGGSSGWHISDEVGGALHYHADYSSPYWSEGLDYIKIGTHKFVKLEGGI